MKMLQWMENARCSGKMAKSDENWDECMELRCSGQLPRISDTSSQSPRESRLCDTRCSGQLQRYVDKVDTTCSTRHYGVPYFASGLSALSPVMVFADSCLWLKE